MRTVESWASELAREKELNLSNQEFDGLCYLLRDDPESESSRLWRLPAKAVKAEIRAKIGLRPSSWPKP